MRRTGKEPDVIESCRVIRKRRAKYEVKDAVNGR
jgi:hypothetical protein